MVRYLPLANGRVNVSFDKHYRIADFYFSEYASENHAGGKPFRTGISVNGIFSWIESDSIRGMDYFDHTLMGNVNVEFEGLSITNQDVVDIYRDVYVRKVKIINNTGEDKEVRMFYHQNFSIGGSELGNTAQFVPELGGVMHYKGNRYFLACVLDETGNSLDQYATGVKEFDGKEGAWKDAEDSELSMNPVSIGSVDSMIRYSATIKGHETGEFFYYIVCSTQMKGLSDLQKTMDFSELDKMLARTSNYWRLWASKWPLLLDEELNSMYGKSLLILRAHMNSIGAIAASCDSDIQDFNRDGYYYVWPRDSAIAAYSMIRAGHSSAARSFFDFCSRAMTDEGYLHHKYRTDGTPASSWLPHVIDGKQILPIQEDETALVLWTMRNYFAHFREVEFIAPYYENLIKKAADFIMNFTREDGLPKESFDLWEERYGIHAYTVATSFAALKSAAYFADVFGETEKSIEYNSHAERMSESFEKVFYSEDKGYYARAIINNEPDFTLDSSLSSLYMFGMRDVRNPRVKGTMEKIMQRLWVPSSGGFARYENDPYQRRSNNGEAGNPWIITTLWVAEYEIASGNFASARKLIDWVVQRRNSSGVLPEQINPLDLSHVSASPLAWSHAQLILTLADYRDAVMKSQQDPLKTAAFLPRSE